MGVVEQLEACITCHAWNRDRSMVALSPNNSDIHIYALQEDARGPKFTRKWVLREHDALVTAIDWAPRTNRLVSSSQDRNAYVWEFQDDEWKPTLVILRLQRAATCVSWSPDGVRTWLPVTAAAAAGCGRQRPSPRSLGDFARSCARFHDNVSALPRAPTGLVCPPARPVARRGEVRCGQW
mmetsp:Transcript_10955/g.32538  ORF Transcript_10955/g.32538 Transcript_10955/m.32538 type:complete len:181 (+) Transcript_10955:62-604(+)